VVDDIARACAALEPELVQMRRDLHARPELSGQERATAAFVAEALERLGLNVITGVGGHGVTAELGAGGPVLLLRADLDALPLGEVPGRPYGSTVAGVMHACGHDAHTAALLGAARLLSAVGVRGRVRLLFQPAEETAAGALAAIEAGVLEDVEAAVAAHVMAPLPFGPVAVWRGEALSGVDFFAITFEGGAGHSAQAGSAAVLAAGRAIAEQDAGFVVASVEGGSAANVLASRVTLRGTHRWQLAEGRDAAVERATAAVESIAAATGTTGTLSVLARVPPLTNAPDVAERVAAAVRATGRAEAIDPGPVPFSDDFAHVAARVPTCFFGVGAGGAEAAPHHHPAFDVDERAVGLTAEILARVAVGWPGGAA
jgi:amidohydrolase